MTYTQPSELDFLDEDFIVEDDRKIKDKVKKRKWREIELVKEKRRLKKELMELDVYYH